MALSTRELCTLTATQAIAAFKAGSLSPVALMEATLARIEAVNPALNAFTEIHAERALDQARAAETAYARGETRPLEGIPVAIKDFHPVAGELTTFGSKAFADHRPTRSAPTVARLLDAGGIMHARTTTPEFAYAPITASPLWSVTRNPWSLEHAPGGSSGGAGAALAAGMTVLADGTDAGGSVRIPAAACHVVGYKPPFGRNPLDVDHPIESLLHYGPMTRSVGDAALMQNVMSGAHRDDMCSLKERVVLPESHAPIEGWTVGVSMDLGMFEIDPEVARNTEAAVDVFRRLGCTIREVTPDWGGFDLPHPYLRYWEGMAASSLGGMVDEWRDEMDPYMVGIIENGRAHTAGTLYRCNIVRGAMYRSLAPILDECDVLVCPSLAVPTVAAEHDCGAEDFRVNGKPVHAYLGWNLCYPFNMVSQCPVIAVPSGLSSAGLPTGIQIVGRTYDDLSVFRAAAAYEAANPWGRAPAALIRHTHSLRDYRSRDHAMTNDLLARDGRTIADIERIRFFPATAVGGEGSYVIEEGGRRVLDFSASWGAACLGYSHPALAEAVSEAVGNMGAVSLASCAVGHAVGLAEDLLARLPDDRDRRVWFGHAGSDANDAVVRLLEAATPRRGILSFVGAYHGGSAASMSVSGHSSQSHAPVRAGLTRLPYPDPYRPQFTPDLVEGALADLDRRFESELRPDEIAAVFIEPIQSDGGLIVPPAGFLKGLEERCRAHGILIVVDEVKVGMGRTGLFHAFEAEGLSPDIVVYGKGLGGGLPISAVVGPAELMNLQPAFAIMTAAGNPVCAAAGRAVMRTIAEEDLMSRASLRGEYLLAGLARLAQRHALIGHVRGRGLTCGVELVRDTVSKEPASSETAKVAFRAHQLGLIFYYVGMESNVLELTPPLTISEDEIDEGLAILDQALEDVAAGRVSDEDIAAYAGW